MRSLCQCRPVTVIPNENWGGEGSLGCGIGFGYLHRIPPAEERAKLHGAGMQQTAVAAGAPAATPAAAPAAVPQQIAQIATPAASPSLVQPVPMPTPLTMDPGMLPVGAQIAAPAGTIYTTSGPPEYTVTPVASTPAPDPAAAPAAAPLAAAPATPDAAAANAAAMQLQFQQQQQQLDLQRQQLELQFQQQQQALMLQQQQQQALLLQQQQQMAAGSAPTSPGYVCHVTSWSLLGCCMLSLPPQPAASLPYSP